MKKKVLIISVIILLTTLIVSLFLLNNNDENKYIRYSFENIPVRIGDKWGYVDTTGKFKVNPQFQQARIYADGLAAVQAKDGLWGFIDTSGTYAINPIYKEVSDFNQGYAVVVRPNSHPEMIRKDGKVKFIFEDVTEASVLIEGRARFVQNKKVGYMDSTGKMIVTPQFLNGYDYSEGLANISQVVGKDTLWGAIDLEGKIVIKPQFDWVGEFKEGLAVFETNEKYGFIDVKGKIVVNPQFQFAGSFHQGLAEIQMGDQYGYIDKNGKIVINPQFESSSPFYNGLAAVQMTKNKWGFINSKGKYVVNPQFKAAGSFHGAGMAVVLVGDKFGCIDSTGKYLINPQYDGVYLWGFDDILFDFDEKNSVSSQYIDSKKLFKNIFYHNNKSILGRTIGMTFSDIKNSHPKDKMEKNGRSASFDLDQFIDVYENSISVSGMAYGFKEDLTKSQRYLVDEDYYYYYYGKRLVSNDKSRLKSVACELNLAYGIGEGREKEIAEMLMKELEKELGAKSKSSDSYDITDLELEKDGYSYLIRFSEKEIPNSILIAITFP